MQSIRLLNALQNRIDIQMETYPTQQLVPPSFILESISLKKLILWQKPSETTFRRRWKNWSWNNKVPFMLHYNAAAFVNSFPFSIVNVFSIAPFIVLGFQLSTFSM